MAVVEYQNIKKVFGAVTVIPDASLHIPDGSFTVFVGPSGCGKSTLLRLTAGLEDATDGKIFIDARDVTEERPTERGIAMVFQSYALYPQMSVEKNLSFGLRVAKVPKDEINKRVARAAGILQIEPLLKRKPAELSGGQRQRVAIGRALVRKPQLLLLDEPLSNLDAALRSDVRLEIAKLHRDIQGTTIYVTHDQVEAMTLADRIVVMNNGRVEQFGSPRELYERPANTFVAAFIGSPRMALLDVERQGNRLGLPGSGSLSLTRLPQIDERELVLGVRPDSLTITTDLAAEGFKGSVIYTEYLGDNTFIYVRLGNGTLVSIRTADAVELAPDTPVVVQVLPDAAHYFSRSTRERLAA